MNSLAFPGSSYGSSIQVLRRQGSAPDAKASKSDLSVAGKEGRFQRHASGGRVRQAAHRTAAPPEVTAPPISAGHEFSVANLETGWTMCRANAGTLAVREFAAAVEPDYQLVTRQWNTSCAASRRARLLPKRPRGGWIGNTGFFFFYQRPAHHPGFPVPATHGLCQDDGVIGSMFYVMEMVDGRSSET